MTIQNPELARSSQMGLPLPWESLHPDQDKRYEPRRGDAANSFESVAIFGLPGEETGIRQEIYLPVHRELHYRGSLFVKHLGGGDLVRVSLRSRDRPNQTLAQAELHTPDENWKKYPFELSLQRSQAKSLQPVDFVIALAAGDERVLVDQASLVPADAIDGLDPEMVQMTRELDTPLMRFGGNFTSAYHWRDGVGPSDKRVSMRNVAWGIPETNQFGTDEFLRFCERIGAEPQIALNLGTGTAEEAADWVRYVNSKWHTHGGLLWELGNELWGSWNTGYPTLQQAGARTLAFSRAVRQADGRAKVIATGQDPDGFESWNTEQLKTPPGTFDFLSTHFVVTTDQSLGKARSREEFAKNTFALPIAIERRLRDIQRQMVSAGQKNPQIAFTEWLFYCCSGAANEAPGFENFGGAVAAGAFLNMLLRSSDIVNIADMTGVIEFAGISKKQGRVFAAPAYYAFKMFSSAEPGVLLKVENSSPKYDVHGGNPRLPEIADVPYLDVVATLNNKSKKLSLFCVNRNLHEELSTEIVIEGKNVGRVAEIEELSAPSLYAMNDASRPGYIRPHTARVQLSGNHLQYTFAPVTVARIDFKLD
jgi:alpha-N-arabinofuranosidase